MACAFYQWFRREDARTFAGAVGSPYNPTAMTETHTQLATVLVSDLVGSTVLLQEVGDERGQRIFSSHQKLLQDIIASNGGRDAKWLGDGMLAAFHSTADAVRCAVRLQQAAHRPISGYRLEIRIGLHFGEVERRDGDYFGETVDLADRICNSGSGGDILCSSFVTELLLGRQAFAFDEADALDGSTSLYRVPYEVDRPAVLLDRPPFTGRTSELADLETAFNSAKEGEGSLVFVAGEPGIGKSRLVQELMETVHAEGATLLFGQCHEGDWTPPYGPFAEAFQGYAQATGADELRRTLGAGAPSIGSIVPALRNHLPELAEPEPLRPEEERVRLFDAVAQFLRTLAANGPTVLVLDDLHWADGDSIALLRHVARLVAQNRLLVLGTYRDVELDRQHPLADALAALRREADYQRIALRGLESGCVRELLGALSDEPPPEPLVSAIAGETYGNPYFLREVLLHLVEAGKLFQDGEWADADQIRKLGIPESVRQVIGRRLSLLSAEANRLLTTAAAFRGTIPFELTTRVCELSEMEGLDAIDEALNAQLLRPASAPDHYAFSHALIRDTLYREMNPSRQVRLHRTIAESMERAYEGDEDAHAGELAYQYHQSAALPGAERGARYAMRAADQAERAYAYDDFATFLRMALEMTPDGEGRLDPMCRLGLALAWALDFTAAMTAIKEAAEAVAASDKDDAANYLADAAKTIARAGFLPGAWELAAKGLEYLDGRRDENWAWLMSLELMRRESQDPEQPGIPLDTPERREVAAAVADVPFVDRPPLSTPFASRAEVLEVASDEPLSLTYLAGEYRRSVDLLNEEAPRDEQRGRIARAVRDWSLLARCHTALGEFDAAWTAYNRAAALADRLAGMSPQTLQLFSTKLELQFTTEMETAEPLKTAKPLLEQPAANLSYAIAPIRAVAAVGYAWLDDTDEALGLLESLLPALERAPGWAPNYTLMANLAAYVLWILERTDHVDVIERNLIEKVVEPDFRFPMQDGRLSMARLCAVRGDRDAAAGWFVRARDVLGEQEARPLLAVTDLNEAEMHIRAGATAGDGQVALLLNAAIESFRRLGMPGWVTYAEGPLG